MDRIIKQLLTFLCVLLAACFAAPSADAFGLEIRVGGSQLGTIDHAEQNDLGTRNLIRENGWLNYDTLSGCAVATKSATGGKGPVIIGETMTRVESAAAKTPGAKILNDMPEYWNMGLPAEEVTSKMMQYNRKWILEQMRSGREIIDIGVDVNRKTPSIFYQMEQNMLRNYEKLHPGAVKVTTP